MFEVLDTESSLGPYAMHAKRVTLKDLVKMHGHPCDGLVTAACALQVGLKALYAEEPVDRTDTRCISNNSPCYGDVAEYLTGGRIRFATQKIDPGLGDEFILNRISTSQTVRVALNPGVFPVEIRSLEAAIRKGQFTLEDVRRCQQLQWEYARQLLQKPLEESFSVTKLEGFHWEADSYVHTGQRGDVINKNVLKDKTTK